MFIFTLALLFKIVKSQTTCSGYAGTIQGFQTEFITNQNSSLTIDSVTGMFTDSVLNEVYI